MVGKDFLFGDKHLRDFGFVMAKSDEADESGLNRDILKGTVTQYRSQAVHYGTVYNSTIVLPFFIVKFDCSYDDNVISPFELRKIQAWLTSSKLPQSLYIVTSEGVMMEYRGIFTDISPYAFNGLNGLNLKFVCDSPFVYDTKRVVVSAEDASEGVTKRMFCDTDEMEEMIYPHIIYHPSESGIVSFKNNNDNGNTMSFTLPNDYDEIEIDCKLKRVLGDGTPLSLSDINMNINEITNTNNVNTGLFKMYWLRLLPERNYVDIQGNGDFVITYKNLQKLGGLVNV